MNHSMPGLLVHHQLLEPIQTYVHRVSDAIQPSHPLSSPSPPAPNPSQHQGLFKWVNSSHEVAKVLEFQLQHQSFQWTPRTDLYPITQQFHSYLPWRNQCICPPKTSPRLVHNSPELEICHQQKKIPKFGIFINIISMKKKKLTGTWVQS